MTVAKIERSVPSAVRPSPRVLQTAAMFGLGVDEQRTLTIVPPRDVPVPEGGIIFVTGPSGGGKTTVLRLIGDAAVSQGLRTIHLHEPTAMEDVPLVDLFDAPLERAMAVLSMAGLGDAFVMLRRPSELSDGQRWRLTLARAMFEAGRETARGDEVAVAGRAVILADEFAATLDRLTATVIAGNVRRWISRSPHTFIAATTHDDLLEALQPDVLIHKGLGGAMEVMESCPAGTRPAAAPHSTTDERSHVLKNVRTSSGQVRAEESARGGKRADDPFASADPATARSRSMGSPLDNLRIERGALADYERLAAFHYRSHRPGAATAVFRIVHRAPTVVGRFLQRKDETTIVGVLVRGLPHLGCALRDHATGGRYRALHRTEAARLLNKEVRTISRVVVDPRWRGLGLAVRLVRAALDQPETIFTEALAAMGQVNPFFARAGMTRYQRPPLPGHARLIDALASIGIEPSMLASVEMTRALLQQRDERTRRWIERELRHWRRGAGGSRDSAPDMSLDDLLRAARDRLLFAPVYYLARRESVGNRACAAVPPPAPPAPPEIAGG